MEFESDPALLRDSFVSIATRGAKNNTYKFALARFLLDRCHGTRNAGTCVRYAEIAEAFFDYYWMQECKSRLRQGPHNQKPVVIQIIRKRFEDDYYPQQLEEIKQRRRQDVEWCIGKIRDRCFDDVIPRFEDEAEQYFGRSRTRPSRRRIFYDYIAREYRDSSNNKRIDPRGGIRLNCHAVRLLRDDYVVLSGMVVFEWIKFLERRNFGIPRLAEKIGGGALGPRDQGRFKKYLRAFSNRCFYCNKILAPGPDTHVDHVLPYDYVGATDLWNLVLACQECNCTKSSGLPPEHYIRRLERRNSQYRHQMAKLDDSLDTMGGEYGVDWHYGNARKHGYPPWPDNVYLARGGKNKPPS